MVSSGGSGLAGMDRLGGARLGSEALAGLARPGLVLPDGGRWELAWQAGHGRFDMMRFGRADRGRLGQAGKERLDVNRQAWLGLSRREVVRSGKVAWAITWQAG
jgi:hypothetical protein